MDTLAVRLTRAVPFSFTAMRSLLDVGVTKALTVDDLPPLDPSDDIAEMTKRLEKSVKMYEGQFFKALKHCFAKELSKSWWNGTAWVLTLVAQALLLRPFVDALAARKSDVLRRAIFFGALFCVASALSMVTQQRKFYFIMTAGWRCKIGAMSLLHAKLLRTRTSAISTNTARTYTLMTSDAIRFDRLLLLYFPWLSSLAVTAALIAMALALGWIPAVVGSAALIGSMAFQFLLGLKFQKLRRFTAQATDDRVKLTSEVLQSMHSVKVCGWENPFLDAIDRYRSVEARCIRRAQILRGLCLGVYFASVPIATLATFSTHAALSSSKTLTVGTVSSVIALLAVARTFLYFLTRYVMDVPEIFVGCERMSAFLALPEIQPKALTGGSKDLLLDLQEAAFKWPVSTEQRDDSRTEQVLSGVNLSVRRGELVVVVGETGCGKTALLHACLEELDLVDGSLRVFCAKEKGIALSPQRPWNVSGSVRDNVILGGGDFDDEAYEAAVESAALDKDIDSWQDGDETIVGEKGLTLSGGQAARLALARCVYAAGRGRTDLALLDDPLSAVDPKVAAHLVDRCIRGRLCRDLNVGVLLATHQRQFLDVADRVVVLGSDGRALANAPLPEILENGGEAADLVCGAGHGMAPEEEEETTTMKTAMSSTVTKPLQVVAKEDRSEGEVSWTTWSEFIGAGGLKLVLIVLGLFVIAEGSLMWSDVLLLRWTRSGQGTGRGIYYQYTALVGTVCLCGVMRGVIFFKATLRASTSLHTRAISRVLHAPLAWIQANPFGRVMNRFSADLAQTDDMLSDYLLDLATFAFLTGGSILFACVAVPPLILIVPPMFYFILKTKRYVSRTMSECKRLDGITRSPVLSIVAATIHGLSPIHAFRSADVQTNALVDALTANAKAFYFWQMATRYLGFTLDSYMVLFTVVLVIAAIALRDFIPPELLAIALVYTFNLLANVQWTVRCFSICEQFLTSVERLLSYANGIVPESTFKEKKGKTMKDYTRKVSRELSRSISSLWSDIEKGVVEEVIWPSEGKIDVVDLQFRYRADAPLVLKGVTMSFPAHSKTGLCGRTGSGKSSTIAALGRLHDVCGGQVIIDGVDVATLPLSELRAAIAVIPQQPALFSGTVRFNINPTGDRSDDAIIAALKESGLLRKFSSSSRRSGEILDIFVEEGGSNWSTGESQLLCLARALVLERRICCIDEATANVDFDTDAHIQETLRTAEAFRSSTLIVIAHRIRTILDADHIVVLQDGKVLETGSPKDLLARPDSTFASMVRASNVAVDDDVMPPSDYYSEEEENEESETDYYDDDYPAAAAAMMG